MLFTRTLRRKLMLGVGLVFVMLLILSVSGIGGLSSYRSVVRELDYDINFAPQRHELIHSIAALLEPFLLKIQSADDAAYQHQLFRERLDQATVSVADYRRRTEDLPPAAAATTQRPYTEALLFSIDQQLTELRQKEQSLGDEKTREATVNRMQRPIMRAIMAARQLPDPVEGLKGSFDHAKRVYRSSLVAVWVTSGVVLLLFLGLLRSGYVWIFHPIRELHQGALRVAHGDFDYRVQLKTRDEMAELATAFNEMTNRFQEIATDLDHQVQERSRQLVRSERLAGVGFLAAGVAHEINNPLSAIAMAAESLESRIAEFLDRLPESEAGVVRQYLQMIQSESFRCKQITERLLDFSRGRDATRDTTDLTHLVAEVVAMVQYLSKYREKKIEFTRTEECYAEVNGPEIKQVVLNLVANALDAMEAGGTLHIRITEQTDQVRIDFQDDGCGMTAEVMENMFEPFFTRKQNGQGTGLGLSISHRIVSQHGGLLSATSAGAGKGSTFTLRLPRRASQGRIAA
jgi:signal transduction histidine kinase